MINQQKVVSLFPITIEEEKQIIKDIIHDNHAGYGWKNERVKKEIEEGIDYLFEDCCNAEEMQRKAESMERLLLDLAKYIKSRYGTY